MSKPLLIDELRVARKAEALEQLENASVNPIEAMKTPEWAAAYEELRRALETMIGNARASTAKPLKLDYWQI